MYDGDGDLVKSIIGDVVTYYPNSGYELRVEGTSESELKYYFAGSIRIAMREDEAITWLLADHLGSTSVTASPTGNLLSSLYYTAFGEIRTGSSFTDYQYTLQKHPGQAGQRNEAEIGLYYYVARYYDPALARFISADTIVPEPGSIKAYDRYAYVNGNPVNFNDPSGHRYCDTADGACTGGGGGGNRGGGSSGGGNKGDVYILPIAGENENNNDSFFTFTHTNGYIMGPNILNKSVNYYGDYSNDPIIQTRNPVALIPPLIDWLTRFSNLLPPIEKDNNFFITYEISYDGGEYLTIENFTITNYYSDHNVYLRNIRIINEYNNIPIIYKDIQLGHGFGSEYKVTDFPISINSHFATEIQINAMCINCMDFGQGFSSWPFRYSVLIPAYNAR